MEIPHISVKDVPQESSFSSCDGSTSSTRNTSGMVIGNRAAVCGSDLCPKLPVLVHDVPYTFLGFPLIAD